MTFHRLISVLLAITLCLTAAGRIDFAHGQEVQAPPPVDQVLRTKDNVQLKITYYPSPAGQDAVPVVMLHDFNETRAVFAPLATYLQNPPIPQAASQPKIAPRAVITVDLRGHGESKAAIAPDGSPVELAAHRLRPEDFVAMVMFDMEAVRSFLVQQNDAGALNLNKLTVVGSGMGANVALLWTAKDWATPPLPTRKQGQDVKAIALLSPRWNYNGLMIANAMKFPPIQRQVSVLLAYGSGDRDIVKDNENMEKIWSKFHPAPPLDKAQQIQDFVVITRKTNLQATKLLNNEDFGLGPRIASFIEAQVGSKPFPWVARKTP